MANIPLKKKKKKGRHCVLKLGPGSPDKGAPCLQGLLRSKLVAQAFSLVSALLGGKNGGSASSFLQRSSVYFLFHAEGLK